MGLQQILLLTSASVACALGNTAEKRDLEECASLAEDFLSELSSIPTADAELVDFIASQTHFLTITDNCLIPTATGSLTAEYSSYASEVASWQMAHKDEVSSLLAACSDVPEVQSQLEQYPELTTVCDKIVWETGSVSSSNDESNASDAAATQMSSDNAAPRETGMAMAAVAVAGLFAAGAF